MWMHQTLAKLLRNGNRGGQVVISSSSTNCFRGNVKLMTKARRYKRLTFVIFTLAGAITPIIVE